MAVGVHVFHNEVCIGFTKFRHFSTEKAVAFMKRKSENLSGDIYLEYRINGCKSYINLEDCQ